MPPISEVISHDEPMILIDELVEAGEAHVHCRVKISEDAMFYDKVKRGVPGYVGIEYMAQSVAAWAGYHAWERGEKPPIGFLLGGRKYASEVPMFRVGMVLDVCGHQLMKNENMAAFSCTIEHNGAVQATCNLNVYEPPAEQQAEMN